MFVTTRNRALTQFSYKVNGFILFCNLLAYTFLKSFFFSSEYLIFVPETCRCFWQNVKAFSENAFAE